MGHQARTTPHALRGYIRAFPNGRFVSVCVRPFLVVEGRSLAEVRTKMRALIKAYVQDAEREGMLDHYMAIDAPLRFRLEYRVAVAAVWLRRFIGSFSGSLQPFTENCPAHA